MPRRSFTENLVDWEAMVTNLEPLVDVLPNMAEDHDRLAALAIEGRGLESEQDAHLRLIRETNQKRNLLQVAGRKLQVKLESTVRGHFGPDSIQLLGYGIKPRQAPRRGRMSPSEAKAKKAAKAAAAVGSAPAAPTSPDPQQP